MEHIPKRKQENLKNELKLRQNPGSQWVTLTKLHYTRLFPVFMQGPAYAYIMYKAGSSNPAA